MDKRLIGWVSENPAVKEALDKLGAEMPGMQVVFADSVGQAQCEEWGVDPNAVLVRPAPDTDVTHLVMPGGEVLDMPEVPDARS